MRASVVVPAHNEERSIGRLMLALAPLRDEVDVVVVCNGCTDQTGDVARRAAPWATVIDLPDPSKPAALNAGDRAVSGFPRLYLDADVVIEATAVERLFEAVRGGLMAAAASPYYDVSTSSWVVRSHQRFWEQMPANRQGLAGTNAMAVSGAGRARFDDWPNLIGDDYFFDGLFDEAEKARVPDAVVVRPTARGFRDCVSRKARVHQGNVDVRAAGLRDSHAGGGGAGIRAVVRDSPARLVDLPAHLAVTVAARLVSERRRRRGTSQVWFQDRSRGKS